MKPFKPLHIRAAVNAADALARFVYIDDHGGAHELAPDDAEYLATAFHPADGARPYIKREYESQSPSGSKRGFLERALLPSHVAVQSVGSGDRS
jgi:hypothetical protein